MTRKDKKGRRKAKKIAWLKKLADKRAEKADIIEDKRAAKIAKWESMGKQDKIDKFTKKWEKKDASFENIRAGKRKGKLAKKAHKMKAKRQRKQQWKKMTPEERQARKQEHFERKEEKKAERQGRRQNRKIPVP